MNSPGRHAREAEPARILVVEDYLPFRVMMLRILEGAGYLVEVVGSVGLARDLCAEHRFDLLITDLALPDGDGFEIAHFAVSRDPGTKVLLMSGSPVNAVVFPAEFVSSRFLMKPFGVDDLVTCVQEVLAQAD